MSADDNGKRDYSPIPTALRNIYEALEDELVWIHGRWKMYRQLFGTNEARVQLLNETAPTFFYELQILWLDYIVLEICKITDPPKTYGHHNLVIGQLWHRLNRTQHSSLAELLTDLHTDVESACTPLRNRRNKKVAHSDLETALGRTSSPIPGISRQCIEDALLSIRKYANAFRVHFIDAEMCFEGFALRDDGTSLLYNLKRASEYRDLESADHEYRTRVRSGKWQDA